MAESDINISIEKSAKETRRHFDVVAEDLTIEIQTVAEGDVANTVKHRQYLFY